MTVAWFDKVYALDLERDYKLKINEYTVNSAKIFRRKDTGELAVLYATECFLFCPEDIGKSVFLDEESAKKTLLG